MENTNTDIKIYVACLAAYNNGILHGAWIDTAQDAEDIYSDVRAMLKASPIESAEEFAIHDYEGFESVSIAEYQGIESVAEIAVFIAEYGVLGAELINHCGDVESANDVMEDHYCGCYSSVAEYAQELTEETMEIPQHLQYYIDYDAMGRDMEINDVFVIETGFEEAHIFWQH